MRAGSFDRVAGRLVLSGVVGALAFVAYLLASLSSERWAFQNALFIALMGVAAFATITPLLGAFAAIIWRHHERIEKQPIAYAFAGALIAAGYAYGLGEMLSFKLPISLLIGGATASAISFVLLTRWDEAKQPS